MHRARRTATGAAVALGCLTAAALTACGSTPSAGTFQPAGGGTGAPAAAPSSQAATSEKPTVVMPPFGNNVHIQMTSWLPSNAAQSAAVIADKNFELAYLYAEYKGGKDNSWRKYADPRVIFSLKRSLSKRSVTTESFKGTIKFTHMQVIPDPNVPGDLDVAACFDNSELQNTSLSTGKVLPDSTPANQHFYRYGDQLTKTAGGQWVVVANFPPVYYPQAKECKP